MAKESKRGLLSASDYPEVQQARLAANMAAGKALRALRLAVLNGAADFYIAQEKVAALELLQAEALAINAVIDDLSDKRRRRANNDYNEMRKAAMSLADTAPHNRAVETPVTANNDLLRRRAEIRELLQAELAEISAALDAEPRHIPWAIMRATRNKTSIRLAKVGKKAHYVFYEEPPY